jgi:hypothetical protein
MNARTLLEHELRRRGLRFSVDAESGRHAVEIGDGRMLVSLDNLQRDLTRDGDTERVSRLVDAIVAMAGASDAALSLDRLYWCLEPTDYEEPASFRVAMSDRVDRVLVHLSTDRQLISWVTAQMLDSLRLSETDAGTKAFSNLARALADSSIECKDIDGVALGYINSSLPFKASLVLAPNLRDVTEAALGWPLMAVIPDRNFLYLWAARHADFVQRVGGVVVREYSTAAHPLSTEVYEITDDALCVVGEFPSK